MGRRKRNNAPVIILLILFLLAASLLGGMIWFMSTHFFVGGKAYANDAQSLDLRDQKMTVAQYEAVREKLPECKIRWNVPFQNSVYSNDSTGLTVQSLSDADLQMLAYFDHLEQIDAAGCRDYDQLKKLKEQYPDVELTYTVDIDGQIYSQDADTVVCRELTDSDIEMMALLPELKTVNASECRAYEQIGKLSASFPHLEVSYRVELMGEVFTEEDTSVIFSNPDVDALLEKLAWLPHVKTVHLVEPAASAEKLRLLMETYPDITFTWDKTVLGKTFNSAAVEYDLTGLSLSATREPRYTLEPMPADETAQIIRTVKEAMEYFPNAEKVILPAYRFDNEIVASYREEMRPEYKVVWTVYVTGKKVRTDQEVIHSSAYKVCFIDELSQDLYYCEDAVVVDIGHSYVKNIEWVRGMPNLKYLILTHNWVKDITPLESCKKLIYLELYWNDYIPDYTPLLGCTALKDLNVSGTFADPEPLAQMTWLENLWATQTRWSRAEEQMLIDSLPNTQLKFGMIDYSAGGWRDVPRYFEMRDIMGLGYNTW